MSQKCSVTQQSHDVIHFASINECCVLGDGCIFVWRLPAEMTSCMLSRLSSSFGHAPSSTYISNEEFSPSPTPERMLSEATGDYR